MVVDRIFLCGCLQWAARSLLESKHTYYRHYNLLRDKLHVSLDSNSMNCDYSRLWTLDLLTKPNTIPRNGQIPAADLHPQNIGEARLARSGRRDLSSRSSGSGRGHLELPSFMHCLASSYITIAPTVPFFLFSSPFTFPVQLLDC